MEEGGVVLWCIGDELEARPKVRQSQLSRLTRIELD